MHWFSPPLPPPSPSCLKYVHYGKQFLGQESKIRAPNVERSPTHWLPVSKLLESPFSHPILRGMMLF